MRPETQRYLEHFCDAATADAAQMLTDAGMEPFALGAALRFSPTRTKAVMREVLQHNPLRVEVVRGSDGRNELRLTPTHETPRWYARILRARAIGQCTATHEQRRNTQATRLSRRPRQDMAQGAEARPSP